MTNISIVLYLVCYGDGVVRGAGPPSVHIMQEAAESGSQTRQQRRVCVDIEQRRTQGDTQCPRLNVTHA